MRVEGFLDTNVLVYAAVADRAATEKRQRALSLIERIHFALSAQVLQEFYVTVTRKLEAPLPAEQALAWIEQLEAFPCIAVDAALVKVGAEISERFRISYWDGAILAAAELAGADVLYSEDLNAGQRYGRVRVVNPFDATSIQEPLVGY